MPYPPSLTTNRWSLLDIVLAPIIMSPSVNFMPLTPPAARDLGLSPSTENLIACPLADTITTSCESPNCETPTNSSPGSRSITISPRALIFDNCPRWRAFTSPFRVASINKSSSLGFSTGIIACICSPGARGILFINNIPLAVREDSPGILNTLNGYTLPRLLKKSKVSWVSTTTKSIKASSSLVVIPLTPLPPLC